MWKWVQRLIEIIRLFWGWRKQDQQAQKQAQQQVEAKIQEIGHEAEMAKERVEILPDSDLNVELRRLQQRAKEHSG